VHSGVGRSVHREGKLLGLSLMHGPRHFFFEQGQGPKTLEAAYIDEAVSTFYRKTPTDRGYSR
jgi:hypothetical protein